MLRKHFPTTDIGASIYGCNLHHTGHLFKVFYIDFSFEETIVEVNKFLSENGYFDIQITDLDENNCFKKFPLTFSPHGYQDAMVLYISNEFRNSQIDFLTNELVKFRNERDWEQFHNPKDLALALSIESNELLELFLWKKPEDANIDKVKEELADVFAYAFLLAEKYNLNVEEILIEKIKKNGEKYPVEKAKGNSTKYDEL
jgi:NTP pyrophosphatase (non-canonical NTP hydrolase)